MCHICKSMHIPWSYYQLLSAYSYMALAIHAGRDAAVLQLTNKHCTARRGASLGSAALGAHPGVCWSQGRLVNA
eukprot:jgi/Chrzof1/10256/Cz04g34140.t1